MIWKQLQEYGQFNMFVGAGISKLPPACAPVWREMLMDFSGALFTCMKREHWPALQESEDGLNELRKFDFRPETFWQRILQHTSLSFACDALNVVNVGQPNLNHRVIAEFVRRNIVHNVVTTNFDEYLDTELGNISTRVVNSSDLQKRDGKPVLFKVHGTISDVESMQFTLDHTKALAEWKSKFLTECLANKPLLLAGYSGYDDDVMPVLLQLGEKIPRVIVIRYPGSSNGEPIQALGRLQNVTILEVNISNEIREWAEEEVKAGQLSPNILLDQSSLGPDFEGHYLKALSKLALPAIPYLLSTLFELAANKQLALQYAYLADDAREDPRYQKTISNKLHYEILMNLSLAQAGTGDERMSKHFFDEASEFRSDDTAPVSNSIFDHVNRVFEYFQQQELTNQQIQEIEMYAGGALKMLQLGTIQGEGIMFRALWCMGRLRNRQKRYADAVGYYQMVNVIPIEFDDIQKGSFALDYGGALLQLSLVDKNGEILTMAMQVLDMAEQLASRISDHMTLAKTKMNLAWAHFFCGEKEDAIRQATDAEKLSLLTGDKSLSLRAHHVAEQIKAGYYLDEEP